VGGQTYNMTPATTKSPGSGVYPTTYKLSWVMPKQSGTLRVVDAGAPLYTMTYLGKTYTRSAPAKIGIVMRGAPFYATVNNQASESYDGMTTSGGTRYYLDKGGRDTVTGMVGEWVRLGSGLFVRKNTVTIAKEPTVIQAYTNQAVYETGYSQDQFRFALSTPTLVTADFDGKALVIRVPLVTTLGLPVLPENSLFASVSGVPSGSGFQYVFQLKENTRLEGYLLERTADGYVVSLKRHLKATPGGPPLLGKTILLDPGHGGSKADTRTGHRRDWPVGRALVGTEHQPVQCVCAQGAVGAARREGGPVPDGGCAAVPGGPTGHVTQAAPGYVHFPACRQSGRFRRHLQGLRLLRVVP
jgi:N-acetylmuramoyl-L-alanine amidase